MFKSFSSVELLFLTVKQANEAHPLVVGEVIGLNLDTNRVALLKLHSMLHCQRRNINNKSKGNAVVTKQAQFISLINGTSRQGSCNQRVGCLKVVRPFNHVHH